MPEQYTVILTNSRQREPLITPFVEGLFSPAVPATNADTDTDSNDAEDTAAPPSTTAAAKALHVVNFTGINLYGKARPFALQELPPALRLRFRQQSSPGRVPLLKAPTTLRRALWDEASEQHLFNGAVGHPLPSLELEQDIDAEALLELTSFPELADGRRRAVAPSQESASAQITYWKFDGEQPTVDQWLSGMGKTRQVDPGDKPDIASDAVKFAGSASVQQPTAGRVRMPKGVPFSELQSDSEESQDDQPEKRKTDAFTALMQEGAADESRSGESSSEQESISGARPSNFAALLQDVPQQASVLQAPSQLRQQTLVRRPVYSPDPPLVASPTASKKTPKPTATKEPSEAPTASSFPTYDRKYATVDDNGLTGHAANQAQWEIENSIISSSTRSRRARTRDQLRQARETSESTSMSISEGFDVNDWRSSESSATPMNYGETQLGGSESWANKTVPSDRDRVDHSASLVETSAPGFSRSAFPPLRSKRVQPTSTARRPTPITGDLIDLTVPAQSEQCQPHVNMQHTTGRALTPQRRQQSARSTAGSDNESIVEKLQEGPNGAKPRVYRTMRQKAQKKASKGKKGGKGKPVKAQLDLPDPAPPPLPAKVPSPVAQPQPIQPATSSSFSDAMTTMMRDTADGTVAVNFGMALLTADQVPIKALRCHELQNTLDEIKPETEFSKALTTNIIDARYLLELSQTFSPGAGGSIDLAGAYVSQSVDALDVALAYELEIVDSSGKTWIVKIDPQQLDKPAIEPVAMKFSCIYLHLPFFVWDAKVVPRLQQPKTVVPEDLKDAVQSFANDFTTPTEAVERGPDFEAEASPQFKVERAQAKRIFTRRMRLDVGGSWAKWQVTQIWDLHLRHGSTIVALAEPDLAMAASGRLWWEATMIYSDADLVPTATMPKGETGGNTQGRSEQGLEADGKAKAAARKLEEIIVKVVEELDNVGLGGMDTVQPGHASAVPKGGAQGKASGKKKAKQEAYVPFW